MVSEQYDNMKRFFIANLTQYNLTHILQHKNIFRTARTVLGLRGGGHCRGCATAGGTNVTQQ